MGKSPEVNTHSHLILPLASNFLLFSVRTISRINHTPEAELNHEGPPRSIYPGPGSYEKACLLSPLDAVSTRALQTFHLRGSLPLLLFPLSFATKQNYVVIYNYFSMRQLNMKNIFWACSVCQALYSCSSWNSTTILWAGCCYFRTLHTGSPTTQMKYLAWDLGAGRQGNESETQIRLQNPCFNHCPGLPYLIHVNPC